MQPMQCPCLCPSLVLLAGLGRRCSSCLAHTSSSAVVRGPCSGPFLAVVQALGCLGLGAHVLLTPCIWFQPKVSALGVVQGPSKDKVAILTVDECDASVALQFGSEIGNYSCAAEGVQTSSKK